MSEGIPILNIIFSLHQIQNIANATWVRGCANHAPYVDRCNANQTNEGTGCCKCSTDFCNSFEVCSGAIVDNNIKTGNGADILDPTTLFAIIPAVISNMILLKTIFIQDF